MATQSENTNGTPAEPTSGSNVTVAGTNGDANGATPVANGIEATENEAVPLKQLYEQSTQYNHWRYAQQQLDDMRNKVNQEVVSSIKQNLQDESDLVRPFFLFISIYCFNGTQIEKILNASVAS